MFYKISIMYMQVAFLSKMLWLKIILDKVLPSPPD